MTEALIEGEAEMGELEGLALPEIVSLDDFLSEPYPDPEVLIEGLIHKNTVSMINGKSKTMKSWFAMALAMHVAEGAPFLGMETVREKVLLVNFEIAPCFLQKRLWQVSNSISETPASQEHLSIWNLRGENFELETFTRQLGAAAAQQDFGLIIIDPIYSILRGKNENDAGDIADVLSQVAAASSVSGAAVLLVHHYTKGDSSKKDAIDRGSGSGVFGRMPDSVILLTQHEKDEHFVLEAVLRNFPPFESKVLKWDHPLHSIAENEDPKRLKAAGGTPKVWFVDHIKPLLVPGRKKAEVRREATKTVTNDRGKLISHRTFDRLFEELIDAGFVREVNNKIEAGNNYEPPGLVESPGSNVTSLTDLRSKSARQNLQAAPA